MLLHVMPLLPGTARSTILAALVVLVALAALALGGCAPSAPAAAQACGAVGWGGWDGDPRCAALAQRTISGADRACRTDADCELVHPGASCREQCAARPAIARLRAEPASCTDPAGGPCPPAHARCERGCCTTASR